MKRSRITIRSFAGCALALSGLFSWAAWPIRTSSATAPPARAAAYVPTFAEASEDEKKNLLATFAEMPLQFVENRGQVDSRVAFYVQGCDRTLYFSPQGITFALTAEVIRRSSRETVKASPEITNAEALFSPAGSSRAFVAADTQHWALKLDFVNANPRVRLKGQGPAKTVTSYFLGPRDQWRTGLASYANLVYEDLWPGIDLVYSGSANRLKYQFVVKPGANANLIRLAYRGASSVSLNGQEQLAVTTPVGEFHDDTPYSYQEINGQRVAVKTSYALAAKVRGGKQGYSFRIGDYDSSRPLVIDPAIVIYAGYIGGAGDERGLGIAVDSAGNPYVTGETSSSQATFPVSAGADMTFDGVRDAFMVKLNGTGAGIVYATYIGGAGDDIGLDVAVDSAGNAYITGSTSSTQNSFPVTVGPDLSHNGGIYDAFVAKLNAAGTALVYCGYIGGSDEDGGTAIAVDGGGNAYITGGTTSSEGAFPVSIGPDLTYNGGLFIGDAFIAKVNVSGTALAYCGYIGGSGEDAAMGIAVDSSGNAYIAGVTTSHQTTFPVAVGPDLTYNGGVRDAFVAKVNTAGTSLTYAGYIGGASADSALGIAVDGAGNAYVAGDTASAETSFPVAVGPDLTYNQSGDAFIGKINPAGTALVYCGYIGGAGRDVGTDIRVDGGGNAYVTGATASNEATFPVTDGPNLNFKGGGFNGDAFVAKVKATGLTLDYCGYLGGNGDDIANALALDSNGNAYIAGETTSTQATFSAIVGPDLTYNGGIRDAFVARVEVCTFSINPSGESFAASGGTGSVSVAAGIGCGRTAISNALWLTITSGASGTGDGTVNYSVALNTGSIARSGNITIGGQTFTVNQAAPAWEMVVLTAGQTEIKTWTFQGRTYAYLKLSFPNAGYRVANWGQAGRTANDFTADAAVERFAGASVQAVTTTAGIYDLGILSPGSYNFTFKNSGAVIKSQAFTVAAPPFPANSIDAARDFVRQQYRDFLNREADPAGENFWTDNITLCSDPTRRPLIGQTRQTEAQCTVRQRETTSGAFFLSPEFQYTGYFVLRMYKGALGRQPKLSEFIPDAQFVGAGILVNSQLSASKVNQNRADFALQFVNCTDAAKYRCAEFKAIYDGLNNQQYVDKLFQTTGVNASSSDRANLVNGLNGGSETRASVLQKVVDGIVVIGEGNQTFTTSYGQTFYTQEFNRAFVQLEYFGYIKRDPDEGGYAFWLGKLNQFGGNFVNAEMVLAFISSPEYRARFGQP